MSNHWFKKRDDEHKSKTDLLNPDHTKLVENLVLTETNVAQADGTMPAVGNDDPDDEIKFLDANLRTNTPEPIDYDHWQEVMRRQQQEESNARGYRSQKFYSTGIAVWGALFSAPIVLLIVIFGWLVVMFTLLSH